MGTSQRRSSSAPDRPDEIRLPGRLALAGLGMLSVVPLLAWVYGLGPFHTWFWAVSAPGLLALAGVAIWAAVFREGGELHRLLSVAVLAGLIGTAGYDLFRVPFVVLGGLRLLSPIESYGVLLADAAASSGLTDFLGWHYHFLNGIGFAVTYAALARGRHWAWGMVWAATLETGTLITPFVDRYSLAGRWGVIAIAYAAHIPYGLVLGFMVQRYRASFAGARGIGRPPTRWALAATIVVLTVWLQPWRTERPSFLAPDDQAAIVDEEMAPEFVRIAPGECFSLFNADGVAYELDQPSNKPTLGPETATPICFASDGVVRLRVTGEPYDGGFVIVDEFARPN